MERMEQKIFMKQEFETKEEKKVVDDIDIEIIEKVPKWRYIEMEKFLNGCYKIYLQNKKPIRFSLNSFLEKYSTTKDKKVKDITNIITTTGEALGYVATRAVSEGEYVYVEF